MRENEYVRSRPSEKKIALETLIELNASFDVGKWECCWLYRITSWVVKLPRMHPFTVPEIRSLKPRCWLGWIPSGSFLQESIYLPFPVFRHHPHSLAHGPFLASRQPLPSTVTSPTSNFGPPASLSWIQKTWVWSLTGKIPHTARQLNPCAPTTEPTHHNHWRPQALEPVPWNREVIAMKRPCSQQLEKAQAQQHRPSTDMKINKCF